MTTSHITQCPHCRTAFRVSDEQLSAAKGAVRCGSCLKVFRADEHLRDTNPTPPMRATEEPVKKPARPTAPAQPAPQPKAPVARAQNASSTTAAISQSSNQAAKPAPVAAASAAALAQADPAWDVGSEFDADDDDDFLFSEESPSTDDDEDIIFMDDDHDLDDDLDEVDDELEFSDSFLALNDRANTDPEAQKPARPSARQTQPELDEEEWSRDLLAEPAKPKPAKSKAIKPLDDLSFSLDADDDMPAKTATRSAFAHHDLDEMVERMAQPRSSNGLWTLAAVLLLVALAGQMLWWQRAQLAHYPSLSPIYAQLCQHVACNLADPQPDASALRPISSVLREMPNQRMRLDAVLINRGTRALPFPNVLLAITDAHGEIVADGLFSPTDYIAGDFRPDDLVPPGQPISISINTNRPVENLDNFRLTFQY